MKFKSKILNMFLSTTAVVALFLANASIGTNCYGLFYQPKFPEKLRK